MSNPNPTSITAADRERLAVSVAIALGLYLLLFLLLLGLHWPPAEGVTQRISPPLSLSVELAGAASVPPQESLQPVLPVAPSSAPASSGGPPSGSIGASGAAATLPPAASSPSASSPAASSSAAAAFPAETSVQPPGSAPASHPASAPQPYYSTGTVIASGPAGGGASAASAQSGGGAVQPGINYRTLPGESPQSAQGGANPGSTGGPVTSQVYQGSAAQGPGNSINPSLVEQAGTPNASSGGSISPTAGAGQAGSGGGQAGGAGQGGAGTPQGQAPGSGSGAALGSAGSLSGPAGAASIEWANQSAKREVTKQPPFPEIPRSELAQLPPVIKVTIGFLVHPDGTVRFLNIDPSTGYPQLDSLLRSWMEEWQFTPVGGSRDAQGKLQYVIQANTAK